MTEYLVVGMFVMAGLLLSDRPRPVGRMRIGIPADPLLRSGSYSTRSGAATSRQLLVCQNQAAGHFVTPNHYLNRRAKGTTEPPVDPALDL